MQSEGGAQSNAAYFALEELERGTTSSRHEGNLVLSTILHAAGRSIATTDDCQHALASRFNLEGAPGNEDTKSKRKYRKTVSVFVNAGPKDLCAMVRLWRCSLEMNSQQCGCGHIRSGRSISRHHSTRVAAKKAAHKDQKRISQE